MRNVLLPTSCDFYYLPVKHTIEIINILPNLFMLLLLVPVSNLIISVRCFLILIFHSLICKKKYDAIDLSLANQ